MRTIGIATVMIARTSINVADEGAVLHAVVRAEFALRRRAWSGVVARARVARAAVVIQQYRLENRACVRIAAPSLADFALAFSMAAAAQLPCIGSRNSR